MNMYLKVQDSWFCIYYCKAKYRGCAISSMVFVLRHPASIRNMCYKIVFGLTCLKMRYYFVFSPICVTHGHPHKLFVPRTVVSTRKQYFCVRVIEPFLFTMPKLCYGRFQLTDTI